MLLSCPEVTNIPEGWKSTLYTGFFSCQIIWIVSALGMMIVQVIGFTAIQFVSNSREIQDTGGSRQSVRVPRLCFPRVGCRGSPLAIGNRLRRDVSNLKGPKDW